MRSLATIEDPSAGWRPVTDAFFARAAANGSALAVEAGDERLSYDGMAERVGSFAARLAARLDGAEPLVGVCLRRDVDLPAWLLAVLSVGGAYLPLDPELPAMRLAHVIEDGAPQLIVASRCYAHLFAGVSVRVMIAEDAEDLPTVPPIAVTPDMLAYVIFTSGSTGRPKGVEITHGALAALMAAMVQVPGFGCGERMLGLTRISFDLAVPDMFLPFYAGGSLALIDLATAGDPDRLAAAFERFRPDLVQGTPSTWLALLEGGWRGNPALRILAGGEAVTRALADRLLPLCSELWNIYGPTETTVWSTCARVKPDGGPVPIGWPMEGYDIHVTDRDLRPLPAGEVGEIVIGGPGVARGYRGRPDLTRERFVAMPGWGRVYRTGDLGRIGQHGALYCLGRSDDQVKVRGFRIELGDVEAAMALQPEIAWCAARVWMDAGGEATLVGYVVPRLGDVIRGAALRTSLAAHLPAYMIPDRIVAATAMPLTPNGKVDRAALPSPFAAAAAREEDASTEARLAAIWCELLGVAAVGSDDDFFDLGGYSLMTVRLARRIEADFGTRLAPIDLLRHPTLRAMTARIDGGAPSGSSAVMPLNAGGTRPPLYWLDAGPLIRTLARGLPAEQPAFSLNLDAEDENALGLGPLAIADVAARLRVHLVSAQPRGPYYLGGWCRWGIVAFELAQQLVDLGDTVGLLVLLDADRPRRSARTVLSSMAGWTSHRTARALESVSQRVEIATRRYVPAHYAGDVLLLRAAEASDDGGWSRSVVGRLAVSRSAGDHLTMLRHPHVEAMSLVLGSELVLHNQKMTVAARPMAEKKAVGQRS